MARGAGADDAEIDYSEAFFFLAAFGLGGCPLLGFSSESLHNLAAYERNGVDGQLHRARDSGRSEEAYGTIKDTGRSDMPKKLPCSARRDASI